MHSWNIEIWIECRIGVRIAETVYVFVIIAVTIHDSMKRSGSHNCRRKQRQIDPASKIKVSKEAVVLYESCKMGLKNGISLCEATMVVGPRLNNEELFRTVVQL